MTEDHTSSLSGFTPEESEDDSKTMSLFEHLGELRNRLVKAFASVFVLFLCFIPFADKLILFIKQPLMKVLPEGQNALHFTGPLDVFIVNIKISFLTAVLAACPIWVYQFWKFFEPALYQKEKKYIFPFVFASVTLFFAGVSFCYFLILPLTLDFLITLGMESGTPIITITDYSSLLFILTFGFGLVFETPVILILLAMLDLVTADGLAKQRRFVLIGVLVVGAMFTPPDPISQLAMAVPVYGMYEISILIIRFLKRKSKVTE